jgi:hypothetical protein
MARRNPFLGTWRIVDMEGLGRKGLDLTGPAHFTFDRNGQGSFRFVAVQGNMDCRYSEQEGRPRVDFTWEGSEECDPVNGRGWAVLEGGAVKGWIFFHHGDESSFIARRGGGKKRCRERRS